MPLLVDLEESVHEHRPHGPMTADATPPVWNGYQITEACPCGVMFERWVTPEGQTRTCFVSRLHIEAQDASSDQRYVCVPSL
jgi:hypothetical protein